MVIDTSTDNISNSPRLQQQKKKTFSPILELEDTANPFADDIKELAIRSKKSNLKGQTHISFGEDEEEADKFDEEAFKLRREHFQKTKSRSEHKSILIRVSSSHCIYCTKYWTFFVSGFASVSGWWHRSERIPIEKACLIRREIVETIRKIIKRNNFFVGGWIRSEAKVIPGEETQELRC